MTGISVHDDITYGEYVDDRRGIKSENHREGRLMTPRYNQLNLSLLLVLWRPNTSPNLYAGISLMVFFRSMNVYLFNIRFATIEVIPRLWGLDFIVFRLRRILPNTRSSWSEFVEDVQIGLLPHDPVKELQGEAPRDDSIVHGQAASKCDRI